MTTLARFILILALVAVPLLSGLQGVDGIATAQGWNNLAPWAAGTAFRQDVPGKKFIVTEHMPYTGPTLSPSVFAVGDVFAGVSPNWVVQLSSTGVIKDTLRATGQSGEMTGSYFSKTGTLYSTAFSASKIYRWLGPGLPHTESVFANTDGGSNSESIVQDTAGFFYVGQADGTRDILKLDRTTGAIIDRWDVPSDGRGSDWIDLAPDQRTIYYTSEGPNIKRYDLVTRTILSNFNVAPLTGGASYALRILPDGGVLVANTARIVRLNSAGAVVRTYDVDGTQTWFAANIDADATSFWSGDYSTRRLYKFDINTGAVLVGPITVGSTGSLAGLSVYGEISLGRCAGNIAPAFVSPTPACGSTINATVGAPVSFTVRSTDANSGDVVSLNSSALPTGATMTPPLPVTGNPAQSVFNWTPTAGQLGNHTVILRAFDACTTAVCTLTINVRGEGDITQPECVLTSIIPGPPKQILVTVRDQQSGLASVEILTATNCTVVIPPFTVGTTNPVVVTATKTNQELSSVVTLRVRDVAGNQVICDPVYTTLSTGTPEGFSLSGNYPNPFNPTTKFEFSIPKEVSGSMATLKVYDLLGREIRTLISEPLSAGTYQAEWNATDNTGRTVESGVYLYRLVVGSYSATKKMTLLK